MKNIYWYYIFVMIFFIVVFITLALDVYAIFKEDLDDNIITVVFKGLILVFILILFVVTIYLYRKEVFITVPSVIKSRWRPEGFKVQDGILSGPPGIITPGNETFSFA